MIEADTPVLSGRFYFHGTDRDKHYQVVEDPEHCLLKDPGSNEWLQCVIYRQVTTGKVFCRAINSFRERFTALEDQP